MGNSLLIYIDVSIRIVMNQKQIDKDIKDTQKALADLVGATYVYLTKNGMSRPIAKQLILEQAVFSIDQLEKVLWK